MEIIERDLGKIPVAVVKIDGEIYLIENKNHRTRE